MTSERLQVTDAPTTDTRPRKPEGDRLSKLARHRHIISQLTAAPTLRASELAAVLGVSGETIRRDLMELQEQKLINRTMAELPGPSRWSPPSPIARRS